MVAGGRTMSAGEVLDVYFLEVRAKLIEIGATLDRVERGEGGMNAVAGDVRMGFIKGALEILRGDAGNKAELIQRLYSKE
jgi:hypothetical protein